MGASGARRGTGPAAVHPPRPRNDTLNLVAFKVAQLVGAAALDEALVAEVLVEGGTVTGLSEREVAATVRSGRAGVEHPRRPGQARPRPPVGRPSAVPIYGLESLERLLAHLSTSSRSQRRVLPPPRSMIGRGKSS